MDMLIKEQRVKKIGISLFELIMVTKNLPIQDAREFDCIFFLRI